MDEDQLNLPGQCDYDPDFSSVPFPNPEEAGALNMATRTADHHGASLVIANDPDADRLACAEKTNGVWRQFTGDEVGIMLASHLLDIRGAQGIPKSKMLFVCSLVSSKMLKAFAEAIPLVLNDCGLRESENARHTNGCVFEETPTGFKWMGNKALECESGGRCLKPVLIYEEALGYAVTSLVRDKDGVSAAAVLVELACMLHARGSTLHSYLSDLRLRYGYYLTNNGYVVADQAQQRLALDFLRNGGKYREYFGNFKVMSVRDAAAGIDTGCMDGTCTLPKGAGEIMTLRFDSGAVFTFRPSGTEPKLKWYAEMRSGNDTDASRKELAALVKAVTGALPF
ncbi:hypothetical protein Esti_005454 [Eimeria stiedai]